MTTETRLNQATALAALTAAADHRRSIRRYEERQIPEPDLRELLRLATRAPSSFNVQPWRFVVIRGDDLKARLFEATNDQQQVLRAPAVIVAYADMEDALARLPEAVHPNVPAEKRDASVAKFRAMWQTRSIDDRATWAVGQTYIALGYLLLAAETMGFATSPMLGYSESKVKAVLALPEHVRVPALVAVGYAAEEGATPHRLPIETLVEFR